MKDQFSLLIVEDEADMARILKREAERRGIKVTLAGTGEEALELLADRFHVMLLDLSLPGMGGLEVFAMILEEPYAPEVVVLTGEVNVEPAVEAMKLGAYDYLRKPISMDRLFMVLEKAAEKCGLRFDNIYLKRKESIGREVYEDIVVVAPQTREIMRLAKNVSETDASVLILGETGTGKDVIAKFIHQNSPRGKGPFVAINCAALQETTLENELFGHEKGSYTDARETKLGFFEVASGGTIFLDEIGDMGTGLQAKLLHVLEKGTFYRIGGTRLVRTDTRIIAATNMDLAKKIADGDFRQDLYYRINMFTLRLPPLRERKEEIIPIAEKFLKEAGVKKRLSVESRAALVHSSIWPGNIRELKHVIMRSVLVAKGEEIVPEDLGFNQALTKVPLDNLHPLALKEVEKAQILTVLGMVEWNKKKAAQMLGISTKTLHRKIQKYQIYPA